MGIWENDGRHEGQVGRGRMGCPVYPWVKGDRERSLDEINKKNESAGRFHTQHLLARGTGIHLSS